MLRINPGESRDPGTVSRLVQNSGCSIGETLAQIARQLEER
jgi:hypothetical protein